MDALNKYLTSLKSQVAALTVSQKLLVVLLVVVMAATIFFTVIYSAKPDMVVLIPQSMTAEDINRVEMSLKGRYEYQISGDKILVPSDKAYAIRGELFASQALPKDTTEAFSNLVRESSFLKTDGASAREWNFATSETLAKILRGFPGIKDAEVIIAKGERMGLGRDAVPSSAGVTVKTTTGDPLTRNQVVAIIDMVRGAVAGLKREDVTLTDGARKYEAPSTDTPMASDMLEYKRSIEDDYVRKLSIMFNEIPNVKIAVNAVPDLSTRNQTKEVYDPKGVVKATIQETSRDMSTTEGGASGEPGVKPNVSAVADSGSGGRHTSSTTSDSSAQTEVRFGKVVENSTFAPGTELKDLTASISLPRSYFVSIYRRMQHDPKVDPDDDKLQPTITQTLKSAQMLAKNTIGAKADDQIRVDWFDDMLIGNTPDPAAASMVNASAMTTLMSQYGKQVVLGGVALGVMGMMLMMVKKSGPSAAGADIDPSVFFNGQSGGAGGKGKRKDGVLDGGDEMFGEANEGEAVLTGIELDDATLQSRKIMDEVSTMIKESPENAATLVKRWMSKGK